MRGEFDGLGVGDSSVFCGGKGWWQGLAGEGKVEGRARRVLPSKAVPAFLRIIMFVSSCVFESSSGQVILTVFALLTMQTLSVKSQQSRQRLNK